jgi:hypothetical protein
MISMDRYDTLKGAVTVTEGRLKVERENIYNPFHCLRERRV